MKIRRTFLFYFFCGISSLATLLCVSACEKDGPPEFFNIGTEVTLVTMHHERGLPNIKVYIKYNVDSFPGYTDLSLFDTSFVSNDLAEVTFPTVPVGHHWFVGFGTDELLNEPVRGSVPMKIHNNFQPRDSVILVSEY